MNKILMLGVATLTLAAAPAMANELDGGKAVKHGDFFAKHDANSDGMISKEEFLAKAAERFDALDTDKDGSISKAESEAKRAEWKEKMKEHRAKVKEKPPVKGDAPAGGE